MELQKSKKSKVKRRPPLPEDDTSGDLLIVDESGAKTKSPVNKPPSASSSGNKKRKKRDSASSDEERWLTAIESGKLEDVDDELKKIKPKDPALMTARQRAMYEREVDGSPSVTTPTLMSLPTGYKEKVMTAEAIQKAAIKSQKRKQLADEKREKDKKKTMERLLKKQESKAAKAAKNKITKAQTPMILYRQNVGLTTVSFPQGMDWPLPGAGGKEPPKATLCSMGCGNVKKYSCSRTNAPLCSLTCYKRNIASRIL
ncbi:INO80 complex subunit B [Tribolium castaneum]|uniref:INO80 complex subunit B-like Protein n=1 Tax=Tribolium castaneum TaxID=7070 RepID=D6X4Z0_TRICA|nr:PREDICTED: INO80 complex subunit B [Tribolium castaneum]EEZ97220.1 INO80 complex subunit B-like Protein [Tribolium castaneum]|eukprot:XP_008198935.1 PREDICTED: INO80 complex subunit B [Tribolium castaneum]